MFSNCTSCCITGQRNTSGGKHYPHFSTFMSLLVPSRVSHDSKFSSYRHNHSCAVPISCCLGSNGVTTLPPVLASLHWVPVIFRIWFKMLLLVFITFHGRAPEYLTESNQSIEVNISATSLCSYFKTKI